MPDFSKCSNKKCKLRKKCYRVSAKGSIWQSYTEFEPINEKECDFFKPELKKRTK